MKVLNIVTCAYRGTIEEQDDTILWLTQAMRSAGADLDVLLSGSAVNYALQGQDAGGLALGDWRQSHPPQIEADIARMLGKGVRVFAMSEDLHERGLADAAMASGIDTITREDAAAMMLGYDQVWRW